MAALRRATSIDALERARAAVASADGRQHERFLFAVSLLASTIVVAARRNIYDPATWENGTIAQNLVAGDGFVYSYFGNPVQPTSIMAPAYPHFLAGVYAAFGETPLAYLVVQFVQALALAVAVVLLYRIGTIAFSRPVGLLAGVAAALYPEFHFAVTVVHQMVFSLLAVTTLVYLLVRFGDDLRRRHRLLVGATIGASALLFPAILFYAPLVALYVFLQRYEGSVQSATRAAVDVAQVAAVAVLVVSPWTIRNYLVHDQFVLVKMNGYNFWRGNVPPAVETGVPNYITELPPDAFEELQRRPEAEGNDLLMHRAIEFVSANPGTFLAGIARKVWYFVWFPPVDSVQTHPLRKLVYAPVLVLGAAGVAASLLRRRTNLSLYLVFVGFSLGYALFFVKPRYHTPTIVPFLLLFGAFLVYRYLLPRVSGLAARGPAAGPADRETG